MSFFYFVAVNASPYNDFPLSNCFGIVYLSILMLGWNKTPETFRKRLSFLSVMVAGMLIYWLWEAMLISYFSLPFIQLPFNSMDEFVTKSNFKVNPHMFSDLIPFTE